jgi:flagellar biosynthesis/type III secretory pathway chaperone
MNSRSPTIAERAGALAELLDEEIALLDLRRSQLSSLCAAIIDRDEDAVERLLDQIERAQELQSATDQKLDSLRRELAARLACEGERMKLSALIASIDEPQRGQLAARRQRIIELAERLQLEHMRTVVLLTECARINRLLLEGLLPGSEGVTTYRADGADAWQADAGLVDTER